MKIPLFRICWDEADIKAVDNVMRRGMNWSCGPEIEEFEKSIAKYTCTKYCVTFNSGTSALHAALLAHDIDSGEVIVPSFTFIATANAALFVGAKPVFADIEEKTFGLDPKDVEKRITKDTKAIIPVHYGGCPCQIEEMRRISDENNIILIEDAAEAMGSEKGKKMVGSFGDSSVLSFCQNKIITTGEGGAVVTNNNDIYKRLKLIGSHGREDGDYFSSGTRLDYISLGYNFRIPSMIAALGISQLSKIDNIIKMREAAVSHYRKSLSGIDEIEIPAVPIGSRNVYQLFTIVVKGDSRDELADYLEKNGIASKVYFDPVHLSKFYREKFGYHGGELPVTERLAKHVMSLPIYPGISQQEIEHVSGSIKNFFNRH